MKNRAITHLLVAPCILPQNDKCRCRHLRSASCSFPCFDLEQPRCEHEGQMCRRDGPVQLPLRQVMNQVPPMLLQRIRFNGRRSLPVHVLVEGTPISRVVAVYVPVAIQLHSALWLRSIPITHYDESPQFTTHPANTAQHKLFAQAAIVVIVVAAVVVVGIGIDVLQ